MNSPTDNLPRIRQVLFNTDKNRNYKFDVNNNVTIRSLRRIITTAANLPKNIQLMYEDKDYSQEEDSTLGELFEGFSMIEFEVKLSPVSKTDKKLKVIIGQICSQHENKYLNFYCYDCKQSICSLCIKNGKHENHDVLEKYDYLQSSKFLVESMFKDMKNFISRDDTMDKKREALHLKEKIQVVYFPSLHKSLESLESKIIDLLECFAYVSQSSAENIKANYSHIKNFCAEGLNKLKEEINIQDILIDEETFLTFDKKYKEMSQEKTRLVEDKVKLEENLKIFCKISTIAEEVYESIWKVIKDCIESINEEKLRREIEEMKIDPIQKEEIFEKMLSDIKLKKSQRKSYSVDKSPWQDRKITEVFHDRTPKSKGKSDAAHTTETSYTLSRKKEEPIPLLNSDKKILEEPLSESVCSEKRFTVGKDGLNISKRETVRRELIPEESLVMKIVPETKEIYVYEDNLGDIMIKTVRFPCFSGINNFLRFSATVNFPEQNKIFISGGQISHHHPTNLFIMYDYTADQMTKLPDMLTPKYSHSMFLHERSIYVVGGNMTNSCEKYDMINMNWSKLSNMNEEERQNSILVMYNNYLYAFFGQKVGNFMETIERLNTRNPKSKWEIVPYKNPDKLNLKISNCGTIIQENKEVLFVGGKTKEGPKSYTFKFNFTNSTFLLTEITMDEPAYFGESKLVPLSADSYGHFHEEGENFLKFQLD